MKYNVFFKEFRRTAHIAEKYYINILYIFEFQFKYFNLYLNKDTVPYFLISNKYYIDFL